MQQMPLTAEEIRTGMMIIVKSREAQARLMMAQELEAEFMTQLRAKYGLDDTWVCYDLLDGFVDTSEVQGMGTTGEAQGAGTVDESLNKSIDCHS